MTVAPNLRRKPLAAAPLSCSQPRYVHVKLVDTVEPLPAMDSNGLADPYAVLRLIGPDKVAYPSHGVRTRTLRRTIEPQWGEWLELQLCGGHVEQDGTFLTKDGSDGSTLLVQVFDADLGFWGVMKILSRTAGTTHKLASSLPRPLIANLCSKRPRMMIQ